MTRIKRYKKPRLFVGVLKRTKSSMIREVFWCSSEPNKKSHGHRYTHIVGPFRTTRGASWCQKYGPSIIAQTVSAMELVAQLDNSKGV